MVRHRLERRRHFWSPVLVLLVVAILSAGGLSASPALAGPGRTAAATSLKFGQQLTLGQQIYSSNGYVALRMGADGNLGVWAGGRLLWSTHTHGRNHAAIDKSGALVVYNPAGKTIWNSHAPGPGNVLVVQNDGNVVVHTRAGRLMWQTKTRSNELGAGATLRAGQYLTGTNGDRLTLGSNGVLVLTGNGKITFSAGIRGIASYLTMQNDGNLVLFRSGHRAIWTSGTARTGAGARLVLRDDGDLLVLSARGVTLWDLQTSRTPPTAAVYAGRLLAMWGGKVTGLPGVKSDLLATSRGQAIRNTDSCGRTVRVDIRVVRFLDAVTSKYKIKINNIITGHGCDSAQHPKGRATDLGGVWNIATGAFTSFGGYWGRNNYTVDRDFAVYASSVLPNGAGLGQRTCPGVSSARLRVGVQFVADSCNHQHIQVQPSH